VGDLSAHFSRAEFACRHCQAQVVPPRDLIHVLEHIRAITGEPLPIVSGYRCPAHNAAVGGKPRSQHLLGTAADIPRYRATQDQAAVAGARGIGLKAGWAIHVDVRLGPRSSWAYPPG
jgi:uncharacterized protein YcbK (DUF882 family)